VHTLFETRRKDVVNRLTQLRQTPYPDLQLQLPADPPSYEEATSPTSPYASVSNALNQIRLDKMIADADILYKQDNVRVYFIAPDGNVSSLSNPLPLIIAQIQGNTFNAFPGGMILISIFNFYLKLKMQKHQPFTFTLEAGCIPSCLAYLPCSTQTQELSLFQTFNHQWPVRILKPLGPLYAN
jgi:hypothetical protein